MPKIFNNHSPVNILCDSHIILKSNSNFQQCYEMCCIENTLQNQRFLTHYNFLQP